MKSHNIFLVAAMLLAGSLPARAQTFTFNNGDLLVVFRQPGQPNLEVDVGPVSQFLNVGPAIPINGFSQTQLQTAYSNLGGLNWAAIGTVRGTSVYGLPINTLFLTNPRSDINSPTSPYTTLSSFKQGAIGNTIATVVGYGSQVGAVPWSAGTPFSALTNTTNVVIISEGDASSYTSIAGSAGDLANNFQQGDIENPTPSPFANGVTRSDFYKLAPSSGAAVYLGYFEFNSGGTLTYYPAIPSSYTPLTRLSVAGANAVLSFTTTNGPLYDVQSSTDLVAGVWNTIASNIAGTGGVLTNTDVGGATVPQRFYRVVLHF